MTGFCSLARLPWLRSPVDGLVLCGRKLYQLTVHTTAVAFTQESRDWGRCRRAAKLLGPEMFRSGRANAFEDLVLRDVLLSLCHVLLVSTAYKHNSYARQAVYTVTLSTLTCTALLHLIAYSSHPVKDTPARSVTHLCTHRPSDIRLSRALCIPPDTRIPCYLLFACSHKIRIKSVVRTQPSGISFIVLFSIKFRKSLSV